MLWTHGKGSLWQREHMRLVSVKKKMNSSYLCIMGNLYCRQAVTATLTCSSKSFRSKKLALDVGVLITNTPAWLGSERELSFLYDRELKGSPLLLSMSKGNHQVIISNNRRTIWSPFYFYFLPGRWRIHQVHYCFPRSLAPAPGSPVLDASAIFNSSICQV